MRHTNKEYLNVAVIVPCYQVEKKIREVLLQIPEFVKHIIVVDDQSPDNTEKVVKELQLDNLTFIKHDINKGVGGAMKTGFEEAKKLGVDVMVKLDGDGQMDPSLILQFVHPILDGGINYTKGNRFVDIEKITHMPFIRRFGNIGLAFLVRAASGYWKLFDPSNGFLAIQTSVWEKLDKNAIAEDFFFESSMLIELSKIRATIQDIPIPAKYGDETSNLSILQVLATFPQKLLKAFLYRIYFDYFILDFNFGSLSLLMGVPMLIFGIIWSLIHWHISIRTNQAATTGTVIIGLLPIILGFQSLMQFITHDIYQKR